MPRTETSFWIFLHGKKRLSESGAGSSSNSKENNVQTMSFRINEEDEFEEEEEPKSKKRTKFTNERVFERKKLQRRLRTRISVRI